MKFKARLIISLILFSLMTITLPLVIVFIKHINPAVFTFSYILGFIIIGTFLWSGIIKIIINLIYVFLISLFLYTFPKYDLGIIIAGTFLIIINPFRIFEYYIKRVIKQEHEYNLSLLVRKKNQTFFGYHRDMKKMFHLPTYIMLVKNKFYKFLRFTIPILLYITGTFFTLYRLKSFTNFSNQYQYYENLIFWFLAILIIFITSLFMQYKGFRSAFRFLLIFIFPLIFYIIYHFINFKNSDNLIKYILFGGSVLGFISVIILQIPYYYARVIYYPYHYQDPTTQAEVFANGLYEKYIYETGHQRHAIYLLMISKADFQEKFKQLLIYANIHQIIITAYTFKNNEINLYCAYQTKRRHQPIRMLKYLAKLYKKENIIMNSFIDYDNLFYPQKFANSTNYIVARVLSDAQLFNQIGLYKNIIISLFLTFPTRQDMIAFAKEQTTTIYDLSNNQELAEARIDIENDPSKIEITVSNLLASSLFHNGQFVRVMVRYSLEQYNSYLLL